MKPFLFLLFAAALIPAAQAQDTDCGCYKAESTPAAIEPPRKTVLRLKLVPGQKFSQSLTTSARSTSVSKTTRFQSEQKVSMTLQSEVLAISPEGNIDVRSTFADMTMSLQMTVNGKPSQSAKDINDRTPQIIRALKGRSLIVTLSPQARVLKTVGASELIQAVFAALPARNAFERQQNKALSESFVKSLSDDRKGFIQMSSPLPEHPVSVGDSWHDTKTFPVSGSTMATASTYQMLSQIDGELRIGVEGKISAKPVASETTVKGSPAVSLTGTQRGVIVLDEETGWTKRGEIKSFMTSRIDAVVNGKPNPATRATVYNTATVRFTMTPAK